MTEDLLIKIVENMGIEIYLQGTMAEGMAYPDYFCTYWIIDSPYTKFYDNKPVYTVWEFELFFYNINPAELSKNVDEVLKTLEENGFMLRNRGYSVASGIKTHTGKGTDLLYLEKIKEE